MLPDPDMLPLLHLLPLLRPDQQPDVKSDLHQHQQQNKNNQNKKHVARHLIHLIFHFH